MVGPERTRTYHSRCLIIGIGKTPEKSVGFFNTDSQPFCTKALAILLVRHL